MTNSSRDSDATNLITVDQETYEAWQQELKRLRYDNEQLRRELADYRRSYIEAIIPRVKAEVEEEAVFRLAAIVDSSDDAIISKTLEGIIVSWNTGAEKIFGYLADEMIGQPVALLVPDDRIDEEPKILERLKQGERIEHFETLRKRKDGTLIHISLTISPIKDATGTIIGASKIARDISDRKQEERRAKTQYTVAQLLSEESSFNIVLPKILRAICHSLEWDIGEFWGVDDAKRHLKCLKIWHTSEFVAPELIAATKSSTAPQTSSLPGQVWATGKPIWIADIAQEPNLPGAAEIQAGLHSACAFPVVSDSEIFGVLVFFSQTTQLQVDNDWLEALMTLGRQLGQFMKRRQAEEQLQQQAQNLQQALRELGKTQSQLIQSEKMSSLGQLVAGVAHEINNPVNFIHGNLEHTRQYTQDLLRLIALYQTHIQSVPSIIAEEIEAIDLEFIQSDFPKILSSMKVGTDRIRGIVQSLRTFSRLDEADMKAVDLHEGIDSTLMILGNRIKAKPDRPGIQVIKDYGNLPKVECYPGQLNQVFMNILCNAIDALEHHFKPATTTLATPLPPASPSVPTITIHTEVLNQQYVRISLTDNAMGMPKKVRDRLFEPFFTTKPVGKGLGMGLPISYQIITDKHKGSLQCISSPGQGTTFVIEIPIQQPNERVYHPLK